jgi:hypothetical protein
VSHLVSHLSGPGMGEGATPTPSAPTQPSLVPAPMPSNQTATLKTALLVGLVALLAYGACCSLSKKST